MIEFDPLAPPDWHNPYPTYRKLREEAPVHYAQKTGTWCVSRYADVAAVLKDPQTFSSVAAFEVLIPPEARRIALRDALEVVRFLYRARLNPLVLRKGMPPSVITSDPPQHDVLRAIVNRGFTPKRVRDWEARIQQVVASCTDGLRKGETFDVVRDLAIPLPVTIIADMLGVEAARHADFKRWSDALIAGSSGSMRSSFAPLLKAMGELIAYMRTVSAARRRDPREDLISTLVDPRHGDALDDGMLGQFAVVLVVAGNETTTNLIGNTVNALLDRPELIERALSEPELVNGLIEEGLRYDSPLQLMFRRTTRACEIAGTRIPEGASITLLLGSANRDERQFEDPDHFDPTRNAKGHLAFGFGPHFCLGAALARLETRAALGVLLPELGRWRRTQPEPSFVDSFMVRGLTRLPLTRSASS